MAKYIPFPAYYDFAPLDISYLFENEKPAGKHGFMKTQGDRFVFEDGTPVRFWGTCLNSGACFPDRDYAEKVAKRIASYGCNIVRLHQLDAEWSTPNIFQMRKGKRMADTRHADPEAFDRLDYLLSCLKKEGIYVYLDMLTYRKYKEADGVRNTVALANCAVPYGMFDRDMIELQKEYCTMLWEHYNPYTGLAYKDDPMFVMCDIASEIHLFLNFGREFGVEPFTGEFRDMFANWCKEKGYAVDAYAVDLNAEDCEELMEFKLYMEEKFFNEMFDHVRSLGVKIPLTGVNFSWRYSSCKANQHLGDYHDSHLNQRHMSWEPGQKYYRDAAYHNYPEWGAMRNARMRQFGMPFYSAEWDLTYPNKYRAESPIMMAAVCMLQNWSGCSIHTYAYSSLLQYMNILGKEVSSESIGSVGYREGVFATWNEFGLFYHSALMVRREDVKPAKNKITIAVKNLNGKIDFCFGTGVDKAAFTAATEMSQIATDYYGEVADAVDENTPLMDLSKGEVVSDTGELYRSWKKGYGTVDTPMTKAVYGDLARNGTVELSGMSVTCSNPFAVVALSSLNNDLDLEHTDAMLLTTVGDVNNTGYKASLAPDRKQRYGKTNLPPLMQTEDLGRAPIVCEVIEAEIAIKTDRRNMVVWAVNAEGFFAGQIPVTYEDGYMKFTVGPKFPSVYYFIQAE